MSTLTKPFNENLLIIYDELQHAGMWGKASIIFTIHKDIFSQSKTKQALNKKLNDLEYQYVEIEADKVEGNLIRYLLQFQNIEHTVFYLSNIDWGGGVDNKDIYRVLNLHRETLIEQKIKIIFFLNLNEVSKLPHYAPDFWAFRHIVLEFATSSPRNKRKPPVGIMQWDLEHSPPRAIDKESNLTLLREINQDILGLPKTSAPRIDIQLNLGYLSWQEGDLVGAEKTLKKGLELAKLNNFSQARAKLLNGLAIIAYEGADYQKAFEMLNSVAKDNPRDCLSLMNKAITLFALNKRRVAIKEGLKLKTLCAQSAWIEYSLGFLYFFAGKNYQALTHFQKTVGLSPNNAFFREALVLCYLSMGLHKKASDQLSEAKKWLLERKFNYGVLNAYIEEGREKSSSLINDAVHTGKFTEKDLVRDPILFELYTPQ